MHSVWSSSLFSYMWHRESVIGVVAVSQMAAGDGLADIVGRWVRKSYRARFLLLMILPYSILLLHLYYTINTAVDSDLLSGHSPSGNPTPALWHLWWAGLPLVRFCCSCTRSQASYGLKSRLILLRTLMLVTVLFTLNSRNSTHRRAPTDKRDGPAPEALSHICLLCRCRVIADRYDPLYLTLIRISFAIKWNKCAYV